MKSISEDSYLHKRDPLKAKLIPRVKICCISNPSEARMAIEYGASAIGLVGEMPSGPGVISDHKINAIAKNVPPPIATFLLTSETEPEAIVAHFTRVQTNTIQFVDTVDKSAYSYIKKKLPNVKLVQVVHVIDNRSYKEALEVSKYVDAILLDSGNPNLDIKVLGGTGKTHNWNISKRIRENIDIPIFLAGGINAENVHQAIDYVKPFGVDLCSGVRKNGALDESKLKAFFDAIHKV